MSGSGESRSFSEWQETVEERTYMIAPFASLCSFGASAATSPAGAGAESSRGTPRHFPTTRLRPPRSLPLGLFGCPDPHVVDASDLLFPD